MKGTILDFLNLAAEKPELARELVELAGRHNFAFTDEVSDDDLEAVSGGNYVPTFNSNQQTAMDNIAGQTDSVKGAAHGLKAANDMVSQLQERLAELTPASDGGGEATRGEAARKDVSGATKPS